MKCVTYHVFVEECTDEEHGATGNSATVPHRNDGYVEMPESPPMYRHVPVAPERIDVVRVPPVGVEVAVCKVQQLADQV